MSQNSSTKISHTIEEIASCLSTNPQVRAIILIGSYARNDANEYSDVDLVVITDTYLLRSVFYRILPPKLNVKELSLLPYPRTIFVDLYKEGSLFIAHVLNEGRILYDDGYYADLRRFPFKVTRKSLLLQLKILKQRIELYDNLSMYGEIFVDCLSHLYSITKNLALIALALKGEIVFNKHQAIERFSLLFPEIRGDITSLAKLEAFSLVWSKGISIPQPFDPTCCEAKIEIYLRKLKRIMSKVEMNELTTKN